MPARPAWQRPAEQKQMQHQQAPQLQWLTGLLHMVSFWRDTRYRQASWTRELERVPTGQAQPRNASRAVWSPTSMRTRAPEMAAIESCTSGSPAAQRTQQGPPQSMHSQKCVLSGGAAIDNIYMAAAHAAVMPGVPGRLGSWAGADIPGLGLPTSRMRFECF